MSYNDNLIHILFDLAEANPQMHAENSANVEVRLPSGTFPPCRVKHRDDLIHCIGTSQHILLAKEGSNGGSTLHE